MGKGKLGAAGAALAAVIAGMVALAAPASAHHSNIGASAQCITGEGTWRVSWTASTWTSDTLSGSHPAVLVQYSTSSGSGPWTTVPNDSSAMPYADDAATTIPGVGVFRNPGSPSFTGFIDFAPSVSDQSVWVRSVPIDDVPASGPWFWDDNFFGNDGGTDLDTRAAGANLTWLNGQDSEDGAVTNKITLKGGECQPPAEPGAELADECATEDGATGITILLENTGGTSATFVVAGVGNVVVGADDQETVFVPVAEDAAYSVAVTVGGEPVPGSPIAGTRDCLSPNPSAELKSECATNQAGAPGIEIRLVNTGTQSVSFTVEGLGGTIDVGAGGNTVVFVPVAEDAAYSIDVRVGGEHVPGSPVAGTRDCLTPEPSAALADECAVSDGVEGITVTLTNTGDQGVTFNVEGIGDVVVGPDEDTTVFVAVDENSSYSVDVIALGDHVPGSPIAGTRDCRSPEPSASLEDECAEVRGIEGVSITLTNTGDDDATFQVDGGDDVVVEAGGSKTVFVQVDEDTDHAIEVTSGGQTVATIEGHRDCRQGVAGASVENECAVDGATEGVAVKLTNTGDDDATFQVDGGDDVVVGPGGSTTVFVPVDENSDYSITVTADGQTLATFEGTRDCRHGVAGVSIAEVCATDEGVEGILLTLTNTGDDDATFQVDGGADIVVAAGAGLGLFVEVAEDSDYSITVTSGGDTVATLEGTRDCRVPDPAASVADECAVDADVEGVSIRLANDGDQEAVFQVDGGEDVVVPAESETTVFVPVAEDEAYSITVTSGGETVASLEGTRDCDEPTTTTSTTTTTKPVEVGGVQNPRPLPRTGSEPYRSMVVGLALLISGAGVVLLAADRRRAASR